MKNNPIPDISRRDRVRLIAMLADDGLTSRQIAERLGISKRRVNQIATNAGFSIGKRGGTGRIGAHVPRLLIGNIADIAAEAGCSRSALVGRAIKAVFEDKATARRMLGKSALPVRRYAAEVA